MTSRGDRPDGIESEVDYAPDPTRPGDDNTERSAHTQPDAMGGENRPPRGEDPMAPQGGDESRS